MLGRVLRWMHSRDATIVAASGADRKSSIDISARLIKLNSLPSILRCLADTSTLNDLLIVIGCVALEVLVMNIALDLILTKPQR